MMAVREPAAAAAAEEEGKAASRGGGLATSAETLARLQQLPDAPGTTAVHLTAPPRGADVVDSGHTRGDAHVSEAKAHVSEAKAASDPVQPRARSGSACRTHPAAYAPSPRVVPAHAMPAPATRTAPVPSTARAPPEVRLPPRAGVAAGATASHGQNPAAAPPTVVAPELPPEDAAEDAPSDAAGSVDLATAVLWPSSAPQAAAPAATHATATVGASGATSKGLARPQSKGEGTQAAREATAPVAAAAPAPARRRSFFQAVAHTAVAAGRAVERASVRVVKGLDGAAEAVFSRVEHASNRLMGTERRTIPADVGVPISERVAAAEAAAGVGPPRAVPVADDEAPPESAGGEQVLYGTPVYDETYVAQGRARVAAAQAQAQAQAQARAAPAPAPGVGAHIKGFFKDMASETASMVKDTFSDATVVASPSYIFGMHGSRAPVPSNTGMATAGAGAYTAMADDNTDETGAGAGAGGGAAAAAAGGSDDTPVDATPVASGSNDVAIRPLPPGWEWALDQHQRVYFINHTDQTTTYDDPRDR